VYNDPNQIFTRSTNSGQSWMTAIALPDQPYFGTLDVGPGGELYSFGADNFGPDFVLNRSTNAQNRLVTLAVDLTSIVNLGGPILSGLPNLNPAGVAGPGLGGRGPFHGEHWRQCVCAVHGQQCAGQPGQCHVQPQHRPRTDLEHTGSPQ